MIATDQEVKELEDRGFAEALAQLSRYFCFGQLLKDGTKKEWGTFTSEDFDNLTEICQVSVNWREVRKEIR